MPQMWFQTSKLTYFKLKIPINSKFKQIFFQHAIQYSEFNGHESNLCHFFWFWAWHFSRFCWSINPMDVLLGLFDQHHPLLYVMLYRADGSESTNFRNKAFQSINQSIKIWSPDGATCISYNCIATLPWIVLLTLSVSIELISSSAGVTSVKFHKHSLLTTRPIDRTGRETWVR